MPASITSGSLLNTWISRPGKAMAAAQNTAA